MHFNLIFLILSIWTFDEQKEDYALVFYKVDNKVEIVINDSLVYASNEMHHNPDLEGDLTYNITNFLTDLEDVVVVRLFNGYEPYPEDQIDKHWEIEYSLFKNGEEIDIMWIEGNDYETGLVFEQKYYL